MTNEIAAQPKIYSFADLDVVGKSSNAFEFEYIDALDTHTGIYISVLGENADVVSKKLEAEIDERERKQKFEEWKAKKSGRNVPEQPVYVKTADNVEFGKQLAAARIAGWRGNTDIPYSFENALKLCKINPHLASAVLEQSNNIANFTPN